MPLQGGHERIGIAKYEDLIRECPGRGLADETYDLDVIEPRAIRHGSKPGSTGSVNTQEVQLNDATCRTSPARKTIILVGALRKFHGFNYLRPIPR
jgi:hypothetical protein